MQGLHASNYTTSITPSTTPLIPFLYLRHCVPLKNVSEGNLSLEYLTNSSIMSWVYMSEQSEPIFNVNLWSWCLYMNVSTDATGTLCRHTDPMLMRGLSVCVGNSLPDVLGSTTKRFLGELLSPSGNNWSHSLLIRGQVRSLLIILQCFIVFYLRLCIFNVSIQLLVEIQTQM